MDKQQQNGKTTTKWISNNKMDKRRLRITLEVLNELKFSFRKLKNL